MSKGSTFDLQIKLLMIGDSGVGKTCLLLRYANDSFSPTFITTIGIDFKIKTVCLDSTVVKLQIWDTAGQERFRTITVSYFRGAQGILLVYDVCDRKSFENISNWISQIEAHADVNVIKVLVGNKCDSDPGKIQVSEAEGQALADEYGIKFFLTSAKNDIRVTQAFESVARDVMTRINTTKKADPGKPLPGVSQAGGGGGPVRVGETDKSPSSNGGCC